MRTLRRSAVQDFVLQPRGQDDDPIFLCVFVEVRLAIGIGRGGKANEGEEEEEHHCGLRGAETNCFAPALESLSLDVICTAVCKRL